MNWFNSSRWTCAAALALLWPSSVLADNPVNGEALYNADCSGCHGASPQTVNTMQIGNGRNARAVNDAAITLVGAMASLRSKYPSGGSNLADVAAYLGSAPLSLSFPSTMVGNTSATQSITVYPSLKSGQDLSGMVVGTTGDFARNGGTCGDTLPAGGSSCTLLIQFAPTAAGTRTGTVTLQHNNTLTPISIALSGSATGGAGQTEGELDASYGIGGKFSTDLGTSQFTRNTVAVQRDGKSVLVGNSDNGFTLVRYTASGSLDTSFNSTGKMAFAIGGGSIDAAKVVIQADGKILVAGTTGMNGNDFFVARATAMGTPDAAFGNNGLGYVTTNISTVTSNGSPRDNAHGMAVQPDGKIVVVGETTVRNISNGGSYYELVVVRYAANGELDSGFGVGGVKTLKMSACSGCDSYGNAVAIQSDGKIVVAGAAVSNNRHFAVARFNSDGTVDSGFGNGGFQVTTVADCYGGNKCQSEDVAYDVAIQADGKIVLVGFAQNGVHDSDNPNNNTTDTNFAVVRYSNSGSLDADFGTGGKVVTRFAASVPTPQSSTWAEDRAFGVAIQSNGSIVVSGESKRPAPVNFALARYTSAGMLDTSFGASRNGKVRTAFAGGFDAAGGGVAIQSDGKILVAGNVFVTSPGSSYNVAVARYLGTPVPTPSPFNPRDLNGDGISDLVWVETVTGQRVVWYMNGTNYAGTGDFGTLDPRWQFVDTGDFNGDGKPDMVLQHTVTGDRYVWFLDGIAITGAALIATVDPVWQIAVVGDFDGDGKPDLVFQNTSTGQRVIWYMNGTSYAGTGDFGTLDPAWQFVGTGDFNGDGKPDMLLQNTSTGARYIWFLNGITITGSHFIGSTPVAWSIAGTGDYNMDGKPDIVLQHTGSGERFVWFMNGPNYASGAALPTVGTNWIIVP